MTASKAAKGRRAITSAGVTQYNPGNTLATARRMAKSGAPLLSESERAALAGEADRQAESEAKALAANREGWARRKRSHNRRKHHVA